MMRLLRPVAVVGLAMACLVSGSCGADQLIGLPDSVTPEGIAFSVTDTTWSHGDTIAIVLRNESAHALGYNLCVADLERWSDGDWRRVKSLPDYVACTLELRLLEPGLAAHGSQIVYAFIDAGTYRLRTTVEWSLGEDGQAELISNGFRIRQP